MFQIGDVSMIFDFLFKKHETDKAELLNSKYSLIKNLYGSEEISNERKKELSDLIEKHGYLPYSQARALTDLTDSEVLYCLEKKLAINETFKDNKFCIKNNEINPVKACGYNDSDWIKREQHDIKLINLAALSDGTVDFAPARFIDWLRQIVILPSGSKENGVLSTTVYLVPFHPRDFGNAYLTASAEEVSEKIVDKAVKKAGICAKEQIQMFVSLARLAGHPVIYDVFPQTGRFSKTVLAHPEIARWIDVNMLIEDISKSLNFAAMKLSHELDEDDVTIVKNIYKSALKGGSDDNLTNEYKVIYNRFSQELEEKKKELSNFITTKNEQKKLQNRVKAIVSKIEGVSSKKIKCDKDITKRGEIIRALIEEGLWTLPDGAWCSSGIPVFEKMFECGSYPVFRHYNAQGHDVSEFAESDCQTPFYFVYLENGKYNQQVVDFYINYLLNLQKDYGFDGYRIAHTDFVVDEMSEKDLRPISYRAPRYLLKKAIETLKEQTPHFAVMSEYRLRGAFFKEYHQDMDFDLLWGNDTKTDYEKTPVDVINDNRELQDYNESVVKNSLLSILKTYNNQDGYFRTANRFLGLTDKEEALFKWFKIKFIPGGKLAQRPSLYVDGDESFSKDGIEATIEDEVSLIRSDDEDFYNRFDAIRRFALDNELTRDGEARIITKNKDGFISWMISKETVKECLVIAANYKCANERLLVQDEEGFPDYKVLKNREISHKKIEIPGDFTLAGEYIYNEDKKDFEEHYSAPNIKTIEIETLNPCEFKIFKIKR